MGLELEELLKKLQTLLDGDPEKAINEALKINGDIRFQFLKAAILIDAGAIVKDKSSVTLGVEIYQDAVNKYPDNAELKYNLANGFHALAISTEYIDFSWYQETHEYRKKARNLFYCSAGDVSSPPDIKSQSFTNLGNVHWSSYRWVEAYDFYMLALNNDKCNGVASSGALKILRYALSQEIGCPDLLCQEIEYLAAHVVSNKESIASYAGRNAVDSILNEIVSIPKKKRSSEINHRNDFVEFVIQNNLTLSPTIHSFIHESDRWDDLNIVSVTTDVDSGSNIPEIFSMFNLIKSDYILARQLFFNAINKSYIDTGTYSDTLDYACYGVNESALSLAQRVSLDILDKVAVASLFYLGIGGARTTSFKQAWFKVKDKTKKLSPKILAEIQLGNTALLALSEVSNDLAEIEGYLVDKQQARNSSTHRFTVLHDMGTLPESASRCIEHYDYEDFSVKVLSTLKLARCAIIYFVQMILLRENRLSDNRDGLAMPMTVPSHEHIRGLDE